MATKKQKRQAAEEKRALFEAEMRQSGLNAQRKDREDRERDERKKWQSQHDKKHNWKNRVKECPHCSDILRASKKQKEAG